MYNGEFSWPNGAHIAVVFISAANAHRHAVEGVSGSAFLAKPFSPKQIVAALVQTIGHEAA